MYSCTIDHLFAATLAAIDCHIKKELARLITEIFLGINLATEETTFFI